MAIYSGFSHKKWWFSIVMLVYQRVIQKPIPVSPCKLAKPHRWRRYSESQVPVAAVPSGMRLSHSSSDWETEMLGDREILDDFSTQKDPETIIGWSFMVIL